VGIYVKPATVGATVVGFAVISDVGIREGLWVGALLVGRTVGCLVGILLGCRLGRRVGLKVVGVVGKLVGLFVVGDVGTLVVGELEG